MQLAPASDARPASPANDASPADATPLARLLGDLTRADWPADALAAHLPRVLDHAGALAPASRLDWLIGLRQAWQRAPEAFPPAARRDLLDLAAAWGCWPLAIEVGQALLCVQRHDAALLDRLRDAYHQMGEPDAAFDASVALQLACPAQPAHAARHRELVAWRDWRAGTLPASEPAHAGDVLRLEPLGHHHRDDFGWQYDDPDIAELCSLPHFESRAAWHDWLDGLHRFGDNPCAVLHRHWGLIGFVGLSLHRGVGCLYYWIGRDFQGHGFGAHAASMLLAAAHRHAGMAVCYAKVYAYNLPSRRTLERMGFGDTGIRGAAPYDDQWFYRVGPHADAGRVADELHTLLDDLDSEVRAAIPLRG